MYQKKENCNSVDKKLLYKKEYTKIYKTIYLNFFKITSFQITDRLSKENKKYGGKSAV